MTIRTILLTTDFSHPAKVAACDATLLAKHFGAELKLVHVLPYPIAVPGAPEYGAQLGEWFTGRATQDTSELETFFRRELKSIPVEYVVLEGDPAKRVVEYAHQHDVDLIVMPAHGQGPFRRFLLGSVTAKVLHDVECPVWTGIHREQLACAETLAINHVVCAVGMGPETPAVISWAASAVASLNARLFLLHVIPRSDPANVADVPPDLSGPVAVQARKQLEALKEQCGVEAESIIAAGEVASTVAAELERLNADLLVIGRSPQAGMFGRLPTTAYAIVRDSRCRVVSV